MQEYRIEWYRMAYATILYPICVLFVKAESPKDAETLARSHLERTLGISSYRIGDAEKVAELPKGHIVRS